MKLECEHCGEWFDSPDEYYDLCDTCGLVYEAALEEARKDDPGVSIVTFPGCTCQYCR